MQAPDAQFLALSAAVGGAAAVVFGAGVWRELRSPAARCWALALALAAGGAAVAAMAQRAGPAAALVAQALMLGWPVAVLCGARHFLGRRPLPGRPPLDLVLWGAAAAALAVHADGAAATLTPLLLHGVVTAALVAGALRARRVPGAAAAAMPPEPAADEGTPAGANALLALAALVLAAALAPGLLTGSVEAPWGTLAGRAGALAVASVLLAGLALTLLLQRREQRLRASRRRLRHLANLDPLTQVPNRRHFQELAEQALRHDRPGSAVLIMFDIDHFKHINDRLGHAAGDRALCLVAQAVSEQLRSDDLAGRFGGDEFVLLLRQAVTADAMRAAERIVGTVQRRARPLQLPALTLSFGMVQMGLAEPLPDALRRADQALYEAKRQGRSRAVAARGDEDAPVFTESQRLGLTPH